MYSQQFSLFEEKILFGSRRLDFYVFVKFIYANLYDVSIGIAA